MTSSPPRPGCAGPTTARCLNALTGPCNKSTTSVTTQVFLHLLPCLNFYFLFWGGFPVLLLPQLFFILCSFFCFLFCSVHSTFLPFFSYSFHSLFPLPSHLPSFLPCLLQSCLPPFLPSFIPVFLPSFFPSSPFATTIHWQTTQHRQCQSVTYLEKANQPSATPHHSIQPKFICCQKNKLAAPQSHLFWD